MPSRTFSGTPPSDFNGALDLKVSASDGDLSISDSFTLTIRRQQSTDCEPPIADQTVAEDSAWAFSSPPMPSQTLTAIRLTYMATLADRDRVAAWLRFNEAGRTFSGTPPLDFNGSFDLKVTARTALRSVTVPST